MAPSNYFEGADSQFGATRSCDIRSEGMRYVNFADNPEEVDTTHRYGEQDPQSSHQPQTNRERYCGYDRAREQIPGSWPGGRSHNGSQDQDTWAQESLFNNPQHRSSQSSICLGEACHCNEICGLLGQREQQLAQAIAKIEALRIQIFDTWKLTKQYDEAESVYKDIIVTYTTDVHMPDTIMALKYSFVEMLMEQKKFAAAETAAEQVWVARNARDPSSELSRMSHRQICSIYSSLGNFEKAENQHRSIYHQELRDAWALENGDGVGRQLAKRRMYQEAAIVQLTVWKERQKLETQGPRHISTIRSGLERISFLEQWSASLISQEGTTAQTESNRSHKHFCEAEIEESLRNLWDAAEKPASLPEILTVGDKLGSRYVALKKYAEAEAVLHDVWAGKKTIFGEASKETMASGRLLAKALNLSGLAEKRRRAVVIYEKIWADGKGALGESNNRNILVGADLGETHYILGQYVEAEKVDEWVLEQRVNTLGRSNSKTLEARYNLCRTIYIQGQQRYDDVREMLREVYDAWNPISPKGNKTLQCGLMLVETLAEQATVGLSEEVLGRIQAVFDSRTGLPEKDRLYLESGHLLGKSLLRQRKYHKAQDVLRPLWEHQAELYEEKQVCLKCGHLYGQCLIGVNEYPHARAVLESVRNAQNATIGNRAPEAIEVSRLLESIQAKIPKLSKNAKDKGGRRWF